MEPIHPPRKSREVIAAEKAERLSMYTKVKHAITDNETRNDPLDKYPSVSKMSQFMILDGVDADRRMLRRTARLQTLSNSIGSGFSMHHIIWVCNGLETVGCNYEAAPERLTPESLRAHRELVLGAIEMGLEYSAESFAAWALVNGPEFIERVHKIAFERNLFDQKSVEEIMNGSAAPSLADGVL